MEHTHRNLKATLLHALFVVLAVLLLPTVSRADAPPEFWTQCPSTGNAPSPASPAAGQCEIPRGIGVDPNVPGHLYVADSANSRIVELTAWGEFVKAWGWGVRDGTAELQTCTVATGCLTGLRGVGAGQFERPAGGVAVDSAGDVYVMDVFNSRVEKFDPEGHFLLMFGGHVNKTTDGNVCTAASGNECGAGVPGTGDGEFGEDTTHQTRAVGSYISIGPDGTIYVGDLERIEKFGADGTFKGQVAVPGEVVQSLAVDQTGNFYLAFVGADPGLTKNSVAKLSAAGAPLCTMAVTQPRAIAVDGAGKVYVEEKSGPLFPVRIHELDSACNEIGTPFVVGTDIGGSEPVDSTGLSVGQACLSPGKLLAEGPDLYLSDSIPTNSFVRAYGPAPDELAACPPPKVPPGIEAQYALSAQSGAASLRAEINPHFWSGGGTLGTTTYAVQYASAACIEAGGWESPCVTRTPDGALGGGSVDRAIRTARVFLSGLLPATEYRFRFLAESEGGGPVFGEGGAEGSDGAEGTFITPAPRAAPPAPDPCPNAALRIGRSATLPDCRAYELVSPLDKNGGDIVNLNDSSGRRAAFDQASSDGDGLTYSAYKAFAGQPSSRYSNQYLASRGAGGWSTRPLNSPQGTTIYDPGYNGNEELATYFQAFTPDLASAWVKDFNLEPLTPQGVGGVINLYRRDNSAAAYEALTISEPTAGGLHDESALLGGYSSDLGHQLFSARAALTPDAAAKGTRQVYDLSGGELHLVSVLPNGTPSQQDSWIGTAAASYKPFGRAASLQHAVSADGSRVFWTAAVAAAGAGRLYARLDGEVTIPISTGANAVFWAAAADGSKVVFTEGSDLYEYDLEEGTKTLIAHNSPGILGASDDASRIYFVSSEQLDAGAAAGQFNLYLREAAVDRFIAVLSQADVSVPLGAGGIAGGTAVSLSPFERRTRVTPDGGALAFMSNRPLTGYDNTDADSGRADFEVFLYRAGGNSLACVSCDLTLARPSGSRLMTPYPASKQGFAPGDLWAAAWIPTWEHELYASRPLSDDGSRLFFNSFVALDPDDTNGAQDVYEWEAEGKGDCAKPGGCVKLISSGESPDPSEFIDASPGGSDVFFTTSSKLDPRDPGLVDVYDARALGGFPVPPAAPECQGDACQSIPPSPASTTPSSASFHGAGTPGKEPPKPRCAKGRKRVSTRNGASRCVAKKHAKKKQVAKKHKRSHETRRAAR